MRVISEAVFRTALTKAVLNLRAFPEPRSVAGPGRSGAIAAVYASYALGIPFVPCDRIPPEHLRPALVIDTATQSGRTLRKIARRMGYDAVPLAIFSEPPRVHFWFEFQNCEVAS